jgi:hypothetical protein
MHSKSVCHFALYFFKWSAKCLVLKPPFASQTVANFRARKTDSCAHVDSAAALCLEGPWFTSSQGDGLHGQELTRVISAFRREVELRSSGSLRNV